MVPLCSVVATVSKAVRTTRLWIAVQKGAPKWWPIGQGTKTARGALMAAVTSLATVIETVGIPRCSIFL